MRLLCLCGSRLRRTADEASACAYSSSRDDASLAAKAPRFEVRNVSSDDEPKEATPSGTASEASHEEFLRPRVYPRFRSETVGAPEAHDMSLTQPLRRVLWLAEELERMLDERPHLLDRRSVTKRIVDEVEEELLPESVTVWLPREDNTYEAYETRGLDVPVGIRVPQEQALFQCFKGDVDAILIEPLDVSQRPVSGIPGLVGESLVAAALRLGQTLLGVVIATGAGFTAAEREGLDSVVFRTSPDLAIAELVERLLARRFAPAPEGLREGSATVSGTATGFDLV